LAQAFKRLKDEAWLVLIPIQEIRHDYVDMAATVPAWPPGQVAVAELPVAARCGLSGSGLRQCLLSADSAMGPDYRRAIGNVGGIVGASVAVGCITWRRPIARRLQSRRQTEEHFCCSNLEARTAASSSLLPAPCSMLGRRQMLLAPPAIFGAFFPRKARASVPTAPVPESTGRSSGALLDVQAARSRLLELAKDGGAPATPVTLPPEKVAEIVNAVQSLEGQTTYPQGLASNAEAMKKLDGNWRLLYTDAPEITGLADLPLFFQLGPVFQPIMVGDSIFENKAVVGNRLGVVAASLRVIGTFRPAPVGTLNAAGVKNTSGNRIDVDFERLVFSVDELLGVSTAGNLKRVATPTPDPNAPQPAVDITYLDEDLRVTRGGDASIFVLVKVKGAGLSSDVQALSASERASLLKESGEAVQQGDDIIRWTSSLGAKGARAS